MFIERLLIVFSQDFGANCEPPIVIFELVVIVRQLLLTLRIRIATSIGTRLFPEQWKNAWKIAVKYALLHVVEASLLTPAV